LRLILLLFALVFALSSLNMTVTFNPIGRVSIFGVSLLILLVFVALKKDKVNYNRSLTITFYLFTLLSFLSALLNSDMGLLYGSIVLFVLYIILTIVFVNLIRSDGNRFVFNSILISHVPLIALSFLFGTYGGGGSFQGIFYTSNAMGSVAATVFILILTVFLNNLELYATTKKRGLRRKLIGTFILSLLSFMLIVITGSRTSFVAGVTVIVLGLFFLLCSLLRKRRLLNLVIKSASLVIATGTAYFVVSLIIPINELLDRYIVSKFNQKAGSGDILDGRGYIWSETFDRAGLFGGGRDFFSAFSHSSHNTFISLLGQYGWIPVFFFICFLLLSAFYSLKYAFHASGDKYRYLPILMLIGFVALSMGESMMFKLSMLATLCCTGVVSTYNYNRVPSK